MERINLLTNYPTGEREGETDKQRGTEWCSFSRKKSESYFLLDREGRKEARNEGRNGDWKTDRQTRVINAMAKTKSFQNCSLVPLSLCKEAVFL